MLCAAKKRGLLFVFKSKGNSDKKQTGCSLIKIKIPTLCGFPVKDDSCHRWAVALAAIVRRSGLEIKELFVFSREGDDDDDASR